MVGALNELESQRVKLPAPELARIYEEFSKKTIANVDVATLYSVTTAERRLARRPTHGSADELTQVHEANAQIWLGAIDHNEMAQFIGGLLASKADDQLLMRLAFKIVADTDIIKTDELVSLWLPFLHRLMDVLEKHITPLLASRFRHMFEALFGSFLTRSVGRRPSKSWRPSYRRVMCLCATCEFVNAFLSQGSNAGRFPLSPIDHAHFNQYVAPQMPAIACEFDMTADHVILRKVLTEDARALGAWEARKQHAVKRLDLFGRAKLGLFGIDYDELAALRFLQDTETAAEPVEICRQVDAALGSTSDQLPVQRLPPLGQLDLGPVRPFQPQPAAYHPLYPPPQFQNPQPYLHPQQFHTHHPHPQQPQQIQSRPPHPQAQQFQNHPSNSPPQLFQTQPPYQTQSYPQYHAQNNNSRPPLSPPSFAHSQNQPSIGHSPIADFKAGSLAGGTHNVTPQTMGLTPKVNNSLGSALQAYYTTQPPMSLSGGARSDLGRPELPGARAPTVHQQTPVTVQKTTGPGLLARLDRGPFTQPTPSNANSKPFEWSPALSPTTDAGFEAYVAELEPRLRLTSPNSSAESIQAVLKKRWQAMSDKHRKVYADMAAPTGPSPNPLQPAELSALQTPMAQAPAIPQPSKPQLADFPGHDRGFQYYLNKYGTDRKRRQPELSYLEIYKLYERKWQGFSPHVKADYASQATNTGQDVERGEDFVSMLMKEQGTAMFSKTDTGMVSTSAATSGPGVREAADDPAPLLKVPSILGGEEKENPTTPAPMGGAQAPVSSKASVSTWRGSGWMDAAPLSPPTLSPITVNGRAAASRLSTDTRGVKGLHTEVVDLTLDD